jgi:hypothetical protein
MFAHNPCFSYPRFLSILFTVLGLGFVFQSCEKDEIALTTPVGVADRNAEGFYQVPEIPYGPGPTRLGQKLSNPYELSNMRRAAALLSEGSEGVVPKRAVPINATHKYVKMIPHTGEEYIQLMDAAEKYDLTFQEQPLEYEVLYQGEEGYRDPTIGDMDLPPMYAAIPVDRYSLSFKDMPHTVIQDLHISDYETQLTFAAYVISGNERDYEAIDGYCHPDCPNWPACLDMPEYTCTPDVAPDEVGTLIPEEYGRSQPNFPEYMLDAAMGVDGEIQPFGSIIVCEVTVNSRPNCRDGQAAVLEPMEHEPGACRWKCVSTGGGGTNPNPGTSTCGCQTSSNRKRPGGKITVVDTQLGDEGVRRAKVRATKYRWGFIWATTDTDDEGCWRIHNTYNVKRAKVQIVFKDRVSDRMVIRSLRGARVHNAFLEAVDFTWFLTRNDKRWNNLCLKIEDDTDDTSLREQTFIAATTNNAVHEYYDDHTDNAPSPGKLSMLIHTLSDQLDAAPMFRKIDQSRLTSIMLDTWFTAFATTVIATSMPTPLRLYWEVAKPDVFLAFGDGRKSDVFKRTVYHEMVHTSQFVRLGSDWWQDNIIYLGNVRLFNFGRSKADRQKTPYGDGRTDGSGRAEVIEGMAFAFGNRFAGAQYGTKHSLITSSLRGRNGHDTEAEGFLFWNNAKSFLPRGLFYDLLDNNSSHFSGVTRGEVGRIRDNVNNISFKEQLRTLNPGIDNMDEFRENLILQQTGSGNSAADIRTLFQSYGY